ncbi:ribonuclease P protein component [Thalassobaculum sp.]|uniref:ribonuclease P protein component n=1 Tax=Thalassobaculum sp. TaxID=2022740 RepID=UPI0032EF27F7
MRTTGAPALSRLLSRADFLRAARGVKAVAPGLVLQVRRRSPDETGDDTRPRVGFTASRKVGNAVVRNRARRRLRSAVADVLSARAEAGFDYVLIARAATAERTYDELLADLGKALDRARSGKGRRS